MENGKFVITKPKKKRKIKILAFSRPEWFHILEINKREKNEKVENYFNLFIRRGDKQVQSGTLQVCAVIQS